MHLVLSLYHIAVDELLIPVFNIHFTVVIFLYFLQNIWTLHIPACFWVLFPAPLLLPVSQFLFSSPLCLSIHAAADTFLPTSTPSPFKMILSWLLILVILFCYSYNVWTMKLVIWQTPYVLIKLPHYFVKDNIQPIKTTLDFEPVKLLEFSSILLPISAV